MAEKRNRPITPKQEQFCQEYLIDLNGKAAAIRAGYSEISAANISCKTLDIPAVQDRINELMKKRSDKTEITSNTVLKEILLLAKSDISAAYDDNGNLLPIKEIPEDCRRAIAGIKVFEEFEGFGKDRTKIGEVREVKFWDKVKALELLGKHLKLFTETIEIHDKSGLAERLNRAKSKKG